MFISFLDELRRAGIPASPKEHLTLLSALDADVIGQSPEEFYYLARTVYVKDEGLLDRFDHEQRFTVGYHVTAVRSARPAPAR